MDELGSSSRAGRVAFTYPDFKSYQLARFCIVAGLEMQSVAVGWQIYDITKRPLDLGLVGLAQFLPGILLFLVSGHAADRLDRRKLLITCYAGFGVCSSLLFSSALAGMRTVYPIYAVVVLLGIVRSFNSPVSRALLTQTVPEEHLTNAVTWNSSVFQGATIMGPSIGGFVYALAKGPSAVYLISALAAVFAIFFTLKIKLRAAKPRPREPLNMKTVLAGTRVYPAKKSRLGLHFAGPVCRVAWRSGGAASRIRERDSKDRALGARPLASLSRDRRQRHGAAPRAPSLARAQWRDHVMVRCGFWRLHHLVRNFAKPDPVYDRALTRGRHGYGQYRRSRHAGADRHAR